MAFESTFRPGAPFTAGVAAFFAGFVGIFVGAANGSVILGIILAAIVIGGVGFALISQSVPEKTGRWGVFGVLTLAGVAPGGIGGLLVGAGFGWFFGWLIYFVGLGRYRARIAPYLTSGQVLWYYGFRIICGAIFTFLVAPILVVMPLSFNAEDFWRPFRLYYLV